MFVYHILIEYFNKHIPFSVFIACNLFLLIRLAMVCFSMQSCILTYCSNFFRTLLFNGHWNFDKITIITK